MTSPDARGENEHLTQAEFVALSVLHNDREPHRTWGRKTDPEMVFWNRLERGVLNANVAARLERRGLAEYQQCQCCGASLGVAITAAGVGAVDHHV